MTNGHLKFTDRREANQEAWFEDQELARDASFVHFCQEILSDHVQRSEFEEAVTEEKRIKLMSKLHDLLYTNYHDDGCSYE